MSHQLDGLLITLDCGQCGALSGERCVTSTGRTAKDMHQARGDGARVGFALGHMLGVRAGAEYEHGVHVGELEKPGGGDQCWHEFLLSLDTTQAVSAT